MLFAAALFALPAAAEPPSAIGPPDTPAAIVANIKRAFDQYFWLNADTYSGDRLKALTGATALSSALYNGAPTIATWRAVRFGKIGRALTGLWPHIHLEIDTATETGRIVEARVSLSFAGSNADLAFDRVTAALGPGWAEDRKAEDRLFAAMAHTQFAPPARRQLIIAYRGGNSGTDKAMSLNFGFDRMLYLVTMQEMAR
jgi:aminopeptidase N